MIEYILLFGLGFLSAGLVALLIAPSIHRSIVRFTEKRLRATMPFSPQEVRAQKDMVRAVLAAENAKTSHELVRERDKIAGLMVDNNSLSLGLQQLTTEKNELVSTVAEMREDAKQLRATIADDNARMDALKNAIAKQDAEISEQRQEIDMLVRRRDALLSELDNIKIEIAANQTQIESLNLRVTNLREERDAARKDGKIAIERAKDLELRLVREENKVFRLEEKLEREVASLADKTTSLERRASEIVRLKERLKESTWEAREAARSLKNAGLPVPAPSAKVRSKVSLVPKAEPEDDALSTGPEQVIETVVEKPVSVFDAIRFADEVRSKNNALTQLLLSSSDRLKDDALREEIANIAAEMIVLTAANDGPGSPIRTILSGNAAQSKQGRLSLAERSVTAMKSELGA